MTDSFPATKRTTYEETFDNGHGGWVSWTPPTTQPVIPDNGVITTRSPWAVDPNHAPPGAGYLHLLAYIHTHPNWDMENERPNRFILEGYSRDLTNARMTLRMRGDVDFKGAEIVLLAQADITNTRANYVLTGQPFPLSKEWTDVTVTLSPDEDQWTCMGTRHDLAHQYGCGTIAEVLRDVNCDLIICMFPLKVVSTTPVDDIHLRRTNKDYTPDWAYLPSGVVQIDTIRIEYP